VRHRNIAVLALRDVADRHVREASLLRRRLRILRWTIIAVAIVTAMIAKAAAP